MKFKLDINLDDEQEAREFSDQYGMSNTVREVAQSLGLKGRGAHKLAKALCDYAFYKLKALLWGFSITCLLLRGV